MTFAPPIGKSKVSAQQLARHAAPAASRLRSGETLRPDPLTTSQPAERSDARNTTAWSFETIAITPPARRPGRSPEIGRIDDPAEYDADRIANDVIREAAGRGRARAPAAASSNQSSL